MKTEKFAQSAEAAMNRSSGKRPTAVTAIGWFWIIAGALMIVVGVITLWHAALMQSQHKGVVTIDGAAAMIRRFVYFFTGVLQSTVGVAVMVMGNAFLRLRKWARTALEVFSWVGLAYTTVNIGIYVSTLFFVKGNALLHGILLAVIAGILYCVPLGFTIYFLRSKKVRDAVATPPRVTP